MPRHDWRLPMQGACDCAKHYVLCLSTAMLYDRHLISDKVYAFVQRFVPRSVQCLRAVALSLIVVWPA